LSAGNLKIWRQIEKPKQNWNIIGCYFFFPCAIRFSRNPCPMWGEREEKRREKRGKLKGWRVSDFLSSLLSVESSAFLSLALYIVVWVFGFPTQLGDGITLDQKF
jgi:hypothetical protein